MVTSGIQRAVVETSAMKNVDLRQSVKISRERLLYSVAFGNIE